MQMRYGTLFFFTVIILVGFFKNAQAADTEAGKANYQMFCATCHGATGIGDGSGAASLNPKPKNLQKTTRSDDELKKIVKEGGASVGLSSTMIAWGTTLSDDEIANIVAFIRTLKK